MCWIIPLIVGVISAILGCLLGKRCCENSSFVKTLREENEKLSQQLNDCQASNKLLMEENETMKVSLAEAEETIANSKASNQTVAIGKEKVKEKVNEVKGKIKGMVSHFSSTDNAIVAKTDTDKVIVFDADLAKSVFGKKIKQDDLTIVEGIGPKIAELFNEAGIKTWAELADTSVERRQEILTAAGTRFAVHNPDTWARQAKLATEGKWQELFDWQKKLDGGVEV